jgi:DNA-binding CsgD family transcriptional regulator
VAPRAVGRGNQKWGHNMLGTPDNASSWASLSKRERAIPVRFAEGLTYQQIGEALFIAPTTVRTHLAAIYRKLDVHNKAALINLANAQSASAAAPSQDVAPCPSVSLPAGAKPTPTPSPKFALRTAENASCFMALG